MVIIINTLLKFELKKPVMISLKIITCCHGYYNNDVMRLLDKLSHFTAVFLSVSNTTILCQSPVFH